MNTPPHRNVTAELDAPYIAEYPGICGGYPVIEKMRFPVRIVVEAYNRLRDVERIASLYPQLTREQIQCALEYYATAPERVDEDIERNARAEREYVEAHGLPWRD